MSMACDSADDVFDGLKVFVEGKDIKIGDHLGEGGQADVKKAELIPSGELVAVKQYGYSEGYEVYKNYITSEIRNLKTAGGHEGIVQFLGVYATSDNSRGRKGVVLEYCAGGSLQEAFQNKENYIRMLYTCGISWIEQIFKAVKHIHDHDLIHRDLKPANILFTSTDLKTLKICDFSDCTTLPKESAVVKYTGERGTSGYRDPEIDAGRDYGNKADIFSLGRTIVCILFSKGPEDVSSLAFFDSLCDLASMFCNRRAVMNPREMEERSNSTLLDALIGLAKNMFSTDVAERPTMDAACVRLQNILDDNRPFLNISIFSILVPYLGPCQVSITLYANNVIIDMIGQ